MNDHEDKIRQGCGWAMAAFALIFVILWIQLMVMIVLYHGE